MSPVGGRVVALALFFAPKLPFIRRHGDPEWSEVAGSRQPSGWPRNLRGVGVAEMARAVGRGRAPRTGADVAAHVVDIVESFATAARRRPRRELHQLRRARRPDRRRAGVLTAWSLRGVALLAPAECHGSCRSTGSTPRGSVAGGLNRRRPPTGPPRPGSWHRTLY